MADDLMLFAIRLAMEEGGVSTVELARRLKGRVSQATIYNYVKNGKPAMSDTVCEIMTVLGLIVTAEKDVTDDRKPRKRQRTESESKRHGRGVSSRQH